MIFIVLDVLKPLQHKKLLEHELEGFGIRLNREPPNISYRRKEKGGINLTCPVSGDRDMTPNTNIEWRKSDFSYQIN